MDWYKVGEDTEAVQLFAVQYVLGLYDIRIVRWAVLAARGCLLAVCGYNDTGNQRPYLERKGFCRAYDNRIISIF